MWHFCENALILSKTDKQFLYTKIYTTQTAKEFFFYIFSLCRCLCCRRFTIHCTPWSIQARAQILSSSLNDFLTLNDKNEYSNACIYINSELPRSQSAHTIDVRAYFISYPFSMFNISVYGFYFVFLSVFLFFFYGFSTFIHNFYNIFIRQHVRYAFFLDSDVRWVESSAYLFIVLFAFLIPIGDHFSWKF